MYALARRGAAVIAGLAVAVSLSNTPASATSLPGTPVNLKSAVTSSSAKLTWSAAANATSYTVCLMTSSTSTSCYRESGPSASTSTSFTGLAPTSGTDYFWKVRAHNSAGTSSSSKASFDLATVSSTAKPAVPTGLTHTASLSSVKISWSPTPNATTYRVCLLESSTSTSCLHLSPRSTSTSATFTALTPTPDTDWYYRVHAYNDTIYTLSARVGFNLPVGAVTNLAAGSVTKTSMKLSWTAAVNAAKYEVQWATSPGMTVDLHSKNVTGTTSSLTSLTPGVRYYYKVRGFNEGVMGPLTAVRAETLPTDPFNATVITYNLCGQDKCRTSAKNAVLPTWSTRKPLAGAIARRAYADIIATQESHDDDTNFITQLPGFNVAAYKSAKTLFYRTAKFQKMRSGTITLDSARHRYAVWAEFRDRETRTRFIVADPHLEPLKGKTNDDIRKAQTRVLLSAVRTANPEDLPVVYAGDFNSNKSNASDKYPGGYDAPELVFAAAGIPDSYTTADNWLNKAYNSCTQAINPPIKHYDHIDHLYVYPEITIHRWQTMITMEDERYATPFASDHNPVRVTLTVPGT